MIGLERYEDLEKAYIELMSLYSAAARKHFELIRKYDEIVRKNILLEMEVAKMKEGGK